MRYGLILPGTARFDENRWRNNTLIVIALRFTTHFIPFFTLVFVISFTFSLSFPSYLYGQFAITLLSFISPPFLREHTRSRRKRSAGIGEAHATGTLSTRYRGYPRNRRPPRCRRLPPLPTQASGDSALPTPPETPWYHPMPA